ncbi:Regulator of nonsense transcripts 1-like protein [Psilocybe cubensis]|uniref:Regulator of nonsense transcripts 1-like protein n=1 Tax=Psilocybe cubensis TaxID=181762 RepID=A0ACB8GQN3_PSICU|nr:Regulator of nonsense transcripts 1-like protein [Psilocybe cubensis]KAH9477349.1 Regulator of nonsense transcripts 1-like protein [Psilocybe cubensis]
MVMRFKISQTIDTDRSIVIAVDNVLERFIAINDSEHLLNEEQILRVATDQSKVNPSLHHYTVNDRVGGDMNENSKLFKQAQNRVENAARNNFWIHLTCAGLGILRKPDFDIALIDEASQITEPCALIPLVKGTKRAVIVGDHVQLRPTVKGMGKPLQYDISLLERLYTNKEDTPDGLSKTMLDVQYRSPRILNIFPSNEFYEGQLKTHESNAEVSTFMSLSQFPWPTENGTIIPTVFIQCSEQEDEDGGRSKSNKGQIEVISRVHPLITSQRPDTPIEPKLAELKIAVLSPYTKQIDALKRKLPSSIRCSTIDSFQGRESDIVIFSTVRCNVSGEVGFLDDPRRLNVMWTRARLALIIVGDRGTMSTNQQWKRALDACTEVVLPTVSNA